MRRVRRRPEPQVPCASSRAGHHGCRSPQSLSPQPRRRFSNPTSRFILIPPRMTWPRPSFLELIQQFPQPLFIRMLEVGCDGGHCDARLDRDQVDADQRDPGRRVDDDALIARGGPHIGCITTTEYGVEARLLQNTKWRRVGASIGSRRIASISPARSSVSGASGSSCTGRRDDYFPGVSPTLKIFAPTASSTRASRMRKRLGP